MSNRLVRPFAVGLLFMASALARHGDDDSQRRRAIGMSEFMQIEPSSAGQAQGSVPAVRFR
jgi:hypothetical protein